MRRWYLKTVDLVALLSLIVNTTLLANAHFSLVTVLGNGSDKTGAGHVVPPDLVCLWNHPRNYRAACQRYYGTGAHWSPLTS